jgi:hypothetical protein
MAKKNVTTTENKAEEQAPVEAESGTGNQNTELSDRIEDLSAEVAQWKGAHDEACALVARMHAAAVGEVRGPKRGVVEDVEDVINRLRARVAELERNAAVERCDVGSTSSGDDKDLAVEAYNLYVKGQADGEYHAWSELDPPTQKLWRDGYNHVASGGKPRTDYEQAVRYLILSAQ